MPDTDTTRATRADTPAIAKARLLTLALQRSAEAGVSTSAVAVLAHLIADSWPKDDGWSAETRDQTIASRLAMHVQSVRRALRELVDAGIVDRRAGVGRCPSRHVVLPARVSAHAHSECAPTLTQSAHRRSLRVRTGAHPFLRGSDFFSDSRTDPTAPTPATRCCCC